MSKQTFLTGLALTLFVVQACGSEDATKTERASGDAGMGGQAGASDGGDPGVDSVGGKGDAGSPDEPDVGGAAGAGTIGVAGAAGAGGALGAAGEPTIAAPEILFSVKRGANGLPDTAVAAQSARQNAIYSSRTASQVKLDGTNEVKVLGSTLGLADEDDIMAFAELSREPQHPTYVFSMAALAQGAPATSVYNSSKWGGTEEGDVYFSEGVRSYRHLGEGGDQYGYNGLLAHQSSLGLATGSEGAGDDVTGLALRDARVPLAEIYFTVSPYSLGAADSAVEATPANERACTVFRSDLSGKNTVAFGCADLGLVAGDEIDALLVHGDGEASKVIFSVKYGSEGAAGSALNDPALGQATGASLFQSTGNATNTLLKAATDLGLGEFYDDELDGVAVFEAPPSPTVPHVAKCNLTYDPFAPAEGGLSYFSGASHIGSNVLVVFGGITGGARQLAYDATTCELLQQKDLPSGFDVAARHAIAPVAGWSAASPLAAVEHFQANSGGQAQLFIKRYDAAGDFVDELSISNNQVSANENVVALVHEPVSDKLYLLLGSSGSYVRNFRLAIVPRPDGVLTSVDPTVINLPTPCTGYQLYFTGTDALGNLYLGQGQPTAAAIQVCGYRPTGELLPSPYTWTPEGPADMLSTQQYGFIVPGGSHFLLSTTSGKGPSAIERGVYQTP